MSRLGRSARTAGWVTVLFLATAPWAHASAQELVPPWQPKPGTVAVSGGGYGTDSEIMRRAGLWWVRTPRNVLGATGAFWEGYRHIELESRWFSRTSGKISPYAMVSGTLQQRHTSEGFGPGVGLGVEYYHAVPVSFTAALGWRSLFTRWREPGYSGDPPNIHWFTIRLEMTLYLER